MKIQPATILLLFVIWQQTYSLLSKNTVSNFTITGINDPNNIALDSTGTKFIVWNNNAQIRAYYTNGTLICFNSFVKQIQRIIWPGDYSPFILSYPGQQFSTLNESTCQLTKTYNIRNFIDVRRQQIFQILFYWSNQIPYVSLSGRAGVYVIDLNSVSNTNMYATIDPALPRYLTTVFSNDLKYVYVVMADPLDGTRYVRIWDATQVTAKPFRQMSFGTSVLSLAPSNDNKTIICVGSYMSNDTTNIYRLDNNGIVKIKASRQKIGKAISIGDGNVVVLFKNQEGSMEVVRAGDGKSIQNATFTTVCDFYDADYKNKVLIVLDSLGRVVTYSYEPDEDVQPIPDPVAPDDSLPLWIIIVAAGAGVVIITAILLFVFRKKLFYRNIIPRKQERESLISDKLKSHYLQKPADERKQDNPRRSVARSVEEEHFVHDAQEKPPAYIPPAPKSSFKRVPREQPEFKPAVYEVQSPDFFVVKRKQANDDAKSQSNRESFRND